MEANEYCTNHPDSEILLPPRKRLLAGLKRQSSESALQSSPENSSSSPLSDYDLRLQNLLKTYKNGSYMSSEEIAKAAEIEAVAASKAAEAARATAEEKAVIAAKAVAAAKEALSRVTSTSSKEGQLKKNKLKKHVPVQHLYKEQQGVEKYGTDEELAHKLHRAINSSPRISKHIPGSKNKYKKRKNSLQIEDNGFPNGELVSPCRAGDLPEDTNSEGSNESSYSKEKISESSDAMHSNGRKRGRIKQKKLPLSLCSFKDRANPKDELNPNSLDPNRTKREKSSTSKAPQTSVEPHANTLSVY